MHGREGEEEEWRSERRIVRVNRHMWPVSTRVAAIGPSLDIGDGSSSSSSSSSPTYFCKDGRRITIGDCALFKPPKDSQPFIGIVRWLTSGKEKDLKLVVNWLYRPPDVKLGKGILLEAAPNEVFYSFHKDEIPAASLLHPCKVAFLPQGVELPSGISSYVCRRVYDITNKRLWWLTDKDYINGRQEEVDQLLYKTQIEMHGATVQPGGRRSPKPMSGPMSTSHTKPSPDSVHNTAFPSTQSHGRGKKRERGDQGSEPLKRERSSRLEDGDLGHGRMESTLKSEIAKITERGGGLVGMEGVEKLLQLMLPDKNEKRVDLASRSVVVGVIAATEKVDCLNWFVQLKGLPVLDEWLQEIHKGKVGDGTGLKDNEKPVEDFLLVLLGALDKLPVNLEALQTCNIGKSVNHLRTHKNMEIQKKARSLVDRWKKRVEVEMAINDAKSGSNQSIAWSSRSRLTESSHVGSRHSGGTSETAPKSMTTQISVSRTASGRLVHAESASKSGAASAGTGKSALSPASTGASCKDGHSRNAVFSGGDIPLTTSRDDKSTSSSQSHNNSQSCSSDHAKTGTISSKDDARSSTAGSKKISGSSSRHRRSNNDLPVSAASGVQKDAGSNRTHSSHRNTTSEKLSHGVSAFEKAVDVAVEASSHKLIVKIPNRGRSPAESASAGSFEDATNLNSRASSPVPSDLPDHSGCGQKENNNASRANTSNDANTNTESWQSNDFKDALTGSDDGNGSPDAIPDHERERSHGDTKRTSQALKASSISPKKEIISSKFNDVSLSSINALINCVKYSEADARSGDNMGMNLLASVAAGEIPKSDWASPTVSPEGNTTASALDSSCTGHGPALLSSLENRVLQDHCQSNNGVDERTVRVDVSNGAVQSSKGHGIYRFPSSEETLTSDHNRHVNSSSSELQQASEACHLSEGNGAKTPASLAGNDEKTISSEMKTINGGNDHTQQAPAIVGVNEDENCKAKGGPYLLSENKKGNVVSSAEREAQTPEDLSLPEVKQQRDTGGAPNGGMSVEENMAVPAPSMESKTEELVLEPLIKANGEEAKEILNRMSDNCHASSASGTDRKIGSIENNKDMKATSEVPLEIPGRVKCDFHLKETDNTHFSEGKMPGSKADEMEEAASATDNSSLSAVGSGADVRIRFDLNEGLNADDGKVCEPVNLPAPACSAAVPLFGQLADPASTSNKLPAPIAVAAAAKGPFVPPDDLLRSKAELGWKGSAATSAFRPAEPRKAPETLGMTNSPQSSDTTLAKHSRPLLDIDLNVADERIYEDMATPSSTPATALPTTRSDLASVSVRGSGGLNLDLNQVDIPDMENCATSNLGRLDLSILPEKPTPVNFPNTGRVGVCRDFDLNDGPLLDESCAEQSAGSHYRTNVAFQPPVTGLGPNNADLGNMSWLSTGSSYSTIPTPSILSNRGEQSFPLLATNGPPRMLGPSTSVTPFTPDIYRAPVMTSSAVPFPPTFQYPVFPFGSSYPLPSVAFSSSSTSYVDPSSGSRLYFPNVQSQVLGPGGAVSSSYMRPYVKLSDCNRNSGVESNKKWSRQGLDLNSGPAGPDIEKGELLPLALRQMPMASSQATSEEQARFNLVSNGILKRKEPESGWDSYKHASWQ